MKVFWGDERFGTRVVYDVSVGVENNRYNNNDRNKIKKYDYGKNYWN